MKTALLYGFVMALAGAAFTLVLFFAGFHDTPDKMRSAQWVGTLGGIAIGVLTMWLAMREKRANQPADASWGYGNAFGVGVLTALFGAIFGAIFGYLYFAIINPGMSEVILEGQLAAMEAKGMSATQIERAEPMMRKWMSPAMLTIMQLFMGFLWGILLALIVAIFMRRPAHVPAPATPPAI